MDGVLYVAVMFSNNKQQEKSLVSFTDLLTVVAKILPVETLLPRSSRKPKKMALFFLFDSLFRCTVLITIQRHRCGKMPQMQLQMTEIHNVQCLLENNVSYPDTHQSFHNAGKTLPLYFLYFCNSHSVARFR